MNNKKKNVKKDISDKRYTAMTPDSIIKDGDAIYGTFFDSFKDLNLLDLDKPCKHLPKWMNKFRLTEWEAFELDMEVGTLVCAVYNNMKLMGMGIIVFYNREDSKVYVYKHMTRPGKAKIAKNLLETTTTMKIRNFELTINNDFKNGKAHVYANAYSKKNGRLVIDMDIDRVSPASIVSIPLGEKKPLYSEKDFFKASGKLVFKDVEHIANKSTVAIIDDHKGYYPYKAHYDWVTGFGLVNEDNQEKYFGINLTHNQSTNEDDYNENIIWVEGDSYPLPPVRFIRDKHNPYIWGIKDKKGYVDLCFQIKHIYKMKVHLGIIKIDYYLPFGDLYGFVKNEFGRIYTVANLTGIGEDKTTRL